MGNYVLGLDLGPTSIGWTAIKTNQDGDFNGFVEFERKSENQNEVRKELIPAIGSRIFPAGVENLGQGQKEKTRNVDRREARGLRRRLRRARSRKLKLKTLLMQNDLLPADNTEFDKNIAKDPFQLRAKAIEEKVETYNIGRIILHLATRRGFKSNRKDQTKDKETGKIKQAISALKKALDGRTLGQFWHEKRQENILEPVRNRSGQYYWVAERWMYVEELAKIWSKQQSFYPEILTKQLHDKIAKILFKQLPYQLSNTRKRTVIGKCELLPSKLRCDMSQRLAQEFRLLQKLNDLQARFKGEIIEIDPNKKQELYQKLMTTKETKWSSVKKTLGLEDEVILNFEQGSDDGLIGNHIDCQLTKKGFIDKKVWLKLSEEKREKIWSKVLGYYEDVNKSLDETIKDIETLAGSKIEKPAVIDNITPPTATVKYSKQALEQIVPHMRDGDNLYQAIQKCGFVNKHRTLKKLPAPDNSGGFHITNPNVKVVLYEVRKLVNRLIEQFGKPDKIVIETMRELRANKEVRQGIQKNQLQRRKHKQQLEEEIKASDDWTGWEDVPRWARDKYILWHEQNRMCPYCGEMIGNTGLFSRDTEIDHILPYSLSLDNSMNNKVICHAKCNQDKGQRTPFDWLGNDEKRWTAIEGAIDHYKPQRKNRCGKKTPAKAKKDPNEVLTENKAKWERFYITKEQIDEIYWQPRFQPETGYITKIVRDYLKRLYNYKVADQKVKTTKGPITAELRKWWDLYDILGVTADGKKDRSDLRHHALDAAVIACTNKKTIDKITKELQRAWPNRRPGEIYVPRPWESFKDDLKAALDKTNVSHKVQRKVKGKLHKDTYYYKETNGIHAGSYITRKQLNDGFSLNMVDKICDDSIRHLVRERLEQHNFDNKKAFIEPLYRTNKDGTKTRVKKVRVFEESDTMVKVRDNMWAKTGVKNANHHVEFFLKSDKMPVCKIWTTFDCAQRLKSKQPVILRQHPDDKYSKWDFWLSLSAGETVILKDKDGNEKLARVIKMSGQPDNPSKIDILFRAVNIGKVEKATLNDSIQQWRLTSMKSIKELLVRKVTIDPLGVVRRAND